MKAVLYYYSLVGFASAFNHQTDPFRQVHQTSKEFPTDLPVPPAELEEEASTSQMNFPQRVFEQVEPRDVLPPLPSRHQEEEIYTRTRPQHETNMQARHMLEKPPPTVIQGTSVQTWTFLPEHEVHRLQVDLTTEGRPMEALVELWQGPTNVPQKLRVYTENGKVCPFSTLLEIPTDYNTLAVKNIGNLQFPLGAIVVDADTVRPNYSNPLHSQRVTNGPNRYRFIQGSSMGTFKFDRNVVSLQVVLQSQGGPISARIELTQGPSNTKQFIDVYSQDGIMYPVSLVIETPGYGKVVRIKNTADMAFPLKAWVEPCTNGSDEEQTVEVVLPEKTTMTEPQHVLPEELGANGHTANKQNAMDIEFQKVVMNDPQRKYSRQFAKPSDNPKIEGTSSSIDLPYFWAKPEDQNDNGENYDQSFPPTNGLHP